MGIIIVELVPETEEEYEQRWTARNREVGYKIARELLEEGNLDETGIPERAASGEAFAQGAFCAVAEFYAFRAAALYAPYLH